MRLSIDPSRHAADPSPAGRAATLGLFLALAAAATAAILWAFFRSDEIAPRPPSPPATRGAAASGPAPGSIEATKVGHEERGAAADAKRTGGAANASPGAVAARGRVATPAGEPIGGALVRFVPADAAAIAPVANDGYLVAPEIVPEHFEPGPLRDALAAARHAITGDDGTFEIEIPASATSGQLLAWAPGRTLATRGLSLPAAAGEGEEHAFTLEPAAAVRGTVRDEATGDAAAHMSVLAAIEKSSDSPIRAIVADGSARARTGADGRYSLVGLAPGNLKIVPRTGASLFVGIPLRQGREVMATAGETADGVDFEVVRGGRVRGIVSDGSGAPVPRAELTAIGHDALAASMRGDLEPYAIAAETKTRSAADGSFEIRGLPLDRAAAVLASAEGFAPSRTEVAALTAAAPDADVAVVLGHGSIVSGIVFDAAGAPAPGTELNISPAMSSLLGVDGLALASAGGKRSAVSDEAGRFVFENLPAGEYSIRPGEPNPYDTFDQAGIGTSVTVDGIAPAEGVEVRLAAPPPAGGDGVISGVVKDDRGEPVADAAVKIESEGAGLFAMFGAGGGGSAKTRADGSFRAGRLDREKTFRVAASRAGHAAAEVKGVAPGSPPVELVLTRSASIAGVVVTADGTPATPPFTVRVVSGEERTAAQSFAELMPDALKSKSRSGETAAGGEGGTFSIPEVMPGLVAVVAEVPGYAPARSPSIGLAPGEAATGIALRVSVGSTLRGTVTLADGAPVRRATVTARPVSETDKVDVLRQMMPNLVRAGARDATTGEDGRFEIAHLASGRYALSAEHAEYAPSREVKVFLAEDAAVTAPAIVMSAGGTIEGKAIEKEKGRAGLLVQLMGEGPMQMSSTDADGKFLIERLPPGGYLLNVLDASSMAAGKGMKMKSKPVEIVADETVKVEFLFGVGVKVHGRVSGAKSASGMMVVTLRRPGGPGPEDVDPLEFSTQLDSARYQAGVAIVGADGTYVIEDIEPGTYVLELPVMPSDPLDFESYSKMDRTPPFRREVTVEKKDLEVDIFVP